MHYEIALMEADIRDAMLGSMRLGLMFGGECKAELEYRWDDKTFTATFHGHAPSLPQPAHPTQLLRDPIAAIQALKTRPEQLPTDIFRNHAVSIEIAPEQGKPS